jgi:hypothetical protein
VASALGSERFGEPVQAASLSAAICERSGAGPGCEGTAHVGWSIALGVVTAVPRAWCIRVNVHAWTPEIAIEEAAELVTATAREAGLPRWPIVLLEAMPADALEP